jgi:phosphoglycolate phosphatase-like HAD superfamily hydrolase
LNFKNLLVDLDGVLLDSKESLIKSYRASCEELAIEPNERDFVSSLGLTLDSIFAKLHPTSSLDSLVRVFRAKASEVPPPMFAHAVDVIQELQSDGVRVFAVTNKDFERATSALLQGGLKLQGIFSPSLGFAPKPNSEMIDAALKGSDKEASIFLGDSRMDQLAARRAGVTFAHASWGYESLLKLTPGEISLCSISELLGLFRKTI